MSEKLDKKERTPEVIIKIREEKLTGTEAISGILEFSGLSDDQYPISPWTVAKKLGFKIYEASLSDGYAGMMMDVASTQDLPTGINEKRAIVLDNSQSLQEKSFTLAHEIGHFALHANVEEDFFDFRCKSTKAYEQMSKSERELKDQEDAADRFAAQLLMPQKIFTKTFYRLSEIYKGQEVKEKLAGIFVVEDMAVEKRLEELNLN